MCKSWFHMEVIINSYVMGKGGKRLGILILSNTKCRFHIYYYIEVRIFSHGWISHFCTPFSNASAHQPHTYNKYLPNKVSTGPNVDPLSLQILYLKMLSSEGRSGFPWTEPRHRTIFSQTRKGKQLSHDIWFSKSTFCSIDINIRKERIMVGIKS